MGKIIAVANQKGGVGKTTTVVNLCAALAEAGERVLLCDLDPQGNATSGLGVSKQGSHSTLYHVLMGEKGVQEAAQLTRERNLWLIPAHMDLAGGEVELVNREGREFLLKTALQAAREHYDYIVIDCPPSLGLLTLNALNAADSVLIPIQCEYYALEGLTQLTNTVQRVKKHSNPELLVEGVLMTMFDGRTNLSVQVVEEVKRYFPKMVYKTVVPRNVRLSEAPSHGRPITVYDPGSRGSASYRELAQEVLANNKREQVR